MSNSSDAERDGERASERESASERRPGRFPGLDPSTFARRAMRSWRLTVTEAFNLNARMRRVRFAGADLHEMSWKPGQDLVVSLPQPDGGVARRHYTIRHLKKDVLDIDFVLHGDSPAVRWANSVQPGAMIEAAGPRGRNFVRADIVHHLFVGDETCIPAIFAMAETLHGAHRATILIEIAGPDARQALASPATLTLEWVERGAGALLSRLQALAPTPEGAHAYLIGETAQVRDQRHYLVERGFTRDQISAEGYWRPGRVGGHDHV